MLLDWTGRELRRDKRGAIPDDLAPILDRLGVDRSKWVHTVRDFGRMFEQAAGRARSLEGCETPTFCRASAIRVLRVRNDRRPWFCAERASR